MSRARSTRREIDEARTRLQGTSRCEVRDLRLGAIYTYGYDGRYCIYLLPSLVLGGSRISRSVGACTRGLPIRDAATS